MFYSVPKIIRVIYGKIRLSRFRYRQMEKEEKTIQLWEFSGNGVQEFIPGDGETFDVGFDYTECGIVKFLESQNAFELTSFLCSTDYTGLVALGISLERTEKIVTGCSKCNFRIFKSNKMKQK